MCDTMKSFYRNIATRKTYWLTLFSFVIIAYGFSTFNPTVSIDDLARQYYIGDGKAMIAATRWGMVLWTKVLSVVYFIPGIDHLLGVILLFLGVIILSTVLYTISENKEYSIKYLILQLQNVVLKDWHGQKSMRKIYVKVE